MVWFLPGISVGLLLELRCPHCSKKQLRARKAKGTEYTCKFCHKKFTREEGEGHGSKSGR